MKYIMYLILIVAMCSCEVFEIPSDSEKATFKANISNISQTPYSRTNNINLITRLSFAIFDKDLNKVKSILQTSDNPEFGSFNLELPKGEYYIGTVGHNGVSTATISSLNKVTFGTGNKITDTFYSIDTVNIERETSYSIILNRCVAAIKIIPTDTIPERLHSLKFYYTGGSSTLDIITGKGCVNSKQTEYREVANEYILYTFPKADNDVVNLNISDNTGEFVLNKTITNIPVKVGYVTNISIPVFDEVSLLDCSEVTIGVTINNTEWDNIYY